MLGSQHRVIGLLNNGILCGLLADDLTANHIVVVVARIQDALSRGAQVVLRHTTLKPALERHNGHSPWTLRLDLLLIVLLMVLV